MFALFGVILGPFLPFNFRSFVVHKDIVEHVLQV
jgi:hypothetical protein